MPAQHFMYVNDDSALLSFGLCHFHNTGIYLGELKLLQDLPSEKYSITCLILGIPVVH